MLVSFPLKSRSMVADLKRWKKNPHLYALLSHGFTDICQIKCYSQVAINRNQGKTKSPLLQCLESKNASFVYNEYYSANAKGSFKNCSLGTSAHISVTTAKICAFALNISEKHAEEQGILITDTGGRESKLCKQRKRTERNRIKESYTQTGVVWRPTATW